MENIDEPLSGRDSLQIIQQMIDTAKQEQKDDGQGWIVWGWMLFLASTLTVVNMRMHWTQPFYFWNALKGRTKTLADLVLKFTDKNKYKENSALLHDQIPRHFKL